MNVKIDPDAGFCPGVVKAIGKAEMAISEGVSLSCLGQIVHNEKEVERLEKLGMSTISLAGTEGSTDVVLIRAHGEPPSTFAMLKDSGQPFIDATCPVVLRLQQKVAAAAERMEKLRGRVVLFAKEGHPETIGLQGNAGGRAVVATDIHRLDEHTLAGPLEIFAQTTMDAEAYREFTDQIERWREGKAAEEELHVHHSICGFVSGRKTRLQAFAASVDVLLFVSGHDSSNGKYLFSLAYSANPRSYFIGGPDDIDTECLLAARTLGISGATSTPIWLMNDVAEKARELAGRK